MKIIVCVKQVPDTSGVVAVKADGTMDRAAMATISNPDDMNALEAALQIKETNNDVKVCVVSMGPPPTESMLRECLAMGADEAYLVSAREFGGADTWATSNTLAAAIEKIGVEQGDIVMCGRQAIDGDTAQVGPQIAEKLGLPQVTYVTAIDYKAGEPTEPTKRPKTELSSMSIMPIPMLSILPRRSMTRQRVATRINGRSMSLKSSMTCLSPSTPLRSDISPRTGITPATAGSVW